MKKNMEPIGGADSTTNPERSDNKDRHRLAIQDIQDRWKKKWTEQAGNVGDTTIVSTPKTNVTIEKIGNSVSTMLRTKDTLVDKTEVQNSPVLVNRNNLQKYRSIISLYDSDGTLMQYYYFGKSSNIDEEYTKKAYLKLEHIETGRIDLWNGVISPFKNVRYAKGRPNGYSEKKIIFSKIEVKY